MSAESIVKDAAPPGIRERPRGKTDLNPPAELKNATEERAENRKVRKTREGAIQ